jgi:hypothetical protein
MSLVLTSAAFLAVAIGVAHSWLGERYLVSRLVRLENLPRIGGSRSFTRHTIRFAWHLTTVAWVGMAGVLIALSGSPHAAPASRPILITVSATFLVSALLSAVGARMRHFSWLVFLAIGLLTAAGLM